MIDTQAIRTKILDLAMRGQLTAQLPEDGMADELISQIKAEKQALIDSGKIRKEKTLPDITENDIPFEIPDNWTWVRIGVAFCIEMGQSPDGSSVSSDGEGLEFHQGKIFFGAKYITDSGQRTTMPTKIAEADSVLLCVRAPVGKVNITERKICIGRGLCAIRPIAGMDTNFLYYSLLTCEKAFINQATGSTFAAIGGDIIKKQPIPLPPLAEQQRIVERIEQAFSVLDIVDTLQAQYADNLIVLKSKLIDAAIQGKLTEQLPEDGSAEELYQQIQAEKQALIKAGKIKKEKPLPEIIVDEIPFEIPVNWKWIRFSDLYSLSNGVASRGTPGGKERKVLRLADLVDGAIRSEGIREIALSDEEFSAHRIKKGDLIFIRVNGSRDKVANAFLYEENEEISYCDHLFCGHRTSELFDAYYVMTVYRSAMVKAQIDPEIKTTAGQNTINQKSMAKILVPLPPLAEQKRITQKIDELMRVFEQ